MIPQDIREILEPFLPEGVPWDDVVVTFRSVTSDAPSWGPRTMAFSAGPSARGLKTVGVSMEGRMVLDRDYGQPDTAAGLALWAHELVHQEQMARIPNFMVVYMNEDWSTPPDRPWENRFELEAYLVEPEVYCSLVEQGFPAGDWIPLGVQIWGCP